MPNFNFHIIASGSYNPIFFIKPYTRNKMIMRLYFLFFLPKIQIPNPNSLIIRSRIQILTIRMHTQRTYPIIVTYKCS